MDTAVVGAIVYALSGSYASCLKRIDKNDPSFTVAYLQCRGIGDDDAEQLADALEGNTALTILYLDSNKIGDRGATKLAERLKTNETLEVLHLGKNKITDSGASVLAEMLQVNRTLKCLWLYNNNISNTGAIKLAEALQWHNSTITWLDLDGNSGISADVKKKIYRLVKINRESPSPEVALQRKIEDFGSPPPQPHPHPGPGPAPAPLPNPNPEPIPYRYIAFDEPENDLGPIRGIFDNEKNPVVSIADAVASLPLELVSELYVANQFMNRPTTKEKMEKYSGLTPCMVAAIYLYTMETDLYKDLNELLRGEDRAKLLGTPGNSFFPYIRLLFSGVRIMSSSQMKMINRGIPFDLVATYPDKYAEGETLIWWAFSSCTSRLSVLENPQFLGTQGARTICQIHTSKSVDVKEFSAVSIEAERLLSAGCALKVTGVFPASTDGLTIITMEDDAEAPPLIS